MKIAAIILLVAGVAPACAESVGSIARTPCSGASQTVSGMGNSFRFTGYCGKLIVSGTGNSVLIDRAGAITVTGTGNLVQYINLNPNPKNPKKPTHPAQSDKGVGNSIAWTKGVEPKSEDAETED